MPWPQEQRDTFLRQQFQAQRMHYRREFADAAFDVIERDGRPVGRQYVLRLPDRIKLIDVALVPEHRGQGIGTALLQALVDEADRAGLPIELYVEAHNPARRLYERFRFVQVEPGPVYDRLERPPG